METLLDWAGPRTYILLGLIVMLAIYIIVTIARRRGIIDFVSVPLVIAIAVLGFGEYQLFSTQNQGTAIVKEVSGNENAYLKCERFSDGALEPVGRVKGMVYYDAPNTAVLKYNQCKDLTELFEGNKAPNIDSILAFNVLLHEAVHTSGEYNEAVTECVAQEKYVETARKSLNIGEATAEAMLSIYQDTFHSNQPEEYRFQEGSCAGHELLNR